jgi:predicted peroxiredoxin
MTGRRKRVLVVVEATPGSSSSRALEALRMSVGVAAAENDVRVLLTGDATRYLDPFGATVPGGVRATGFLDALERLGAEVIRDGDPAEHLGATDVMVRWTA